MTSLEIDMLKILNGEQIEVMQRRRIELEKSYLKSKREKSRFAKLQYKQKQKEFEILSELVF